MKNRVPRLGRKRLNDLLEEATIDCYNLDEEICGLFTMIQDELEVPFETEILGVQVTVERIDLAHNVILAVCRRGRFRQRVPLLDLALPSPLPKGSEWIETYRHWLGGR
jgi:hypothetical protein